jgi:general stress protein YciG
MMTNIMATDNNNKSDSKSNRGFAAMDPEKQREIASMGGRSQGKENNSGNFANDPEKARRAGQEGGSR